MELRLLCYFNVRISSDLLRRYDMNSFLTDESGQGLVEYALILALTTLVIISGLSLFGGEVRDLFTRSIARLPIN